MLLPALERQTNLCRFKTNLVYLGISRTQTVTHRLPVSKEKKKKRQREIVFPANGVPGQAILNCLSCNAKS